MSSLSPESPTQGYWIESRRPLVSLVFIAPLLAIYEVGVVLLGPQAVRNGADVWLRQLLEIMGFGQYFLLPVLTVCILLGWHHITQEPWRVSTGVFWGMLGECIILALCLRLILQVQGTLLAEIPGQVLFASLDVSGTFRRAIGFLGAGVYEELLFRLILFSVTAWFVERLAGSRRIGTVVAVIVTSLTFATAHYLGPYGELLAWTEFTFWFSFVFRLLAGVFFSLLFVYRGFGITAGTHAGYDLLVGIAQF